MKNILARRLLPQGATSLRFAKTWTSGKMDFGLFDSNPGNITSSSSNILAFCHSSLKYQSSRPAVCHFPGQGRDFNWLAVCLYVRFS